MIYYVCHPGHAYTMAVVLLYYGRALRPCFRFVPYGRLHLLADAAPGTVIWTDFDRLAPAALAEAGALRRELVAKQRHLAHLNDPLSSRQRFDLLRHLHATGINGFDVRRPGESLDALRYPVFLRDEVGASYSAPELLRDRAALEAALDRIGTLGFERPMIVEFGARPGPDGCYRKYGAFRVGERIYPQHCFMQRQWFVKHSELLIEADQRREFFDYLRDNPHAAALRRIFDAAGLQYGRIDYTLVEGRIQVFEINTNPAVLSSPPTWFDDYREAPHAADHIAALLALPAARQTERQLDIDRRHGRTVRSFRPGYRRAWARLTLAGARRRLRRLLR